MNFRKPIAAIVLVALVAPALRAADKPAAKSPGSAMDYGPYLASSLVAPGDPRTSPVLAYKSLNIKVGNGMTVSFDTDTLRYAAGWTGDFLDLSRTHLTTPKGDGPPRPGGKLAFTTKDAPGWAAPDGSLADPRTHPLAPGLGPLPADHARYTGLHLSGNSAVIAYSVGTSKVLEIPASTRVKGGLAFVRMVEIDKADHPLTMVIADAADGFAAAVAYGPDGLRIETIDGRLVARIPAGNRPIAFTLVFGNADPADLTATARSLNIPVTPTLLARLAAPRWKARPVTRGVAGKAHDGFPYVVDTLTLPFENVYGSWMRITAFDFFEGGKSAALCTWNGDVWVVSGIDDKLQNLTWKRFATGLYEPLGLKIKNGIVHTTGRDQITRLHDTNADGEADFYENLSNDLLTNSQYHHFKFDLDTDTAGNLYFVSGGAWNTTPFARDYSFLIRMSPDGRRIEKIARGFRAPNGLAVGPDGQIVIGDNQGHWMPASKINYIPPGKTGGFYGFPTDPRVPKKDIDPAKIYPAGLPKDFEPPLCWIPYSLDTSSAGQAFITSQKWGPLQGSLVHTSYGKSALFVVLYEIVDGVAQGGVWQMPLLFESGIQRARFNPADGQLYVAGLRGWQAGGAKDGCFQRVRYTNQPLHAPKALRATAKGLYLTFAATLDPAAASDPANFDIEQWNYRWTPDYGSPEYSVQNPAKKGRDTLEIASAKLQPDNRTVFLATPDIRPVMQMAIRYHLKSQDGKTIEGAVYNTIHKLPAQ